MSAEVEVEFTSYPPIKGYEFVPSSIEAGTDHSLRYHGIEFKFRRPWSSTKIKSDLSKLFKYLEINSSHIVNYDRGSIHLHINVQHMQMQHLFLYLILLFIAERELVHRCDKSRWGNHHCLSTCEAEANLDQLAAIIQDHSMIRALSVHARYCAFNLSSISIFGSLEFRALEFTLDREKVFWYINFLHKLKLYIQTLTDLSQIKEGLISNPVHEANKIFSSINVTPRLHLNEDDVVQSEDALRVILAAKEFLFDDK